MSKFHKQASDPNSKVMFYTTSETGKDETISTKSYYHNSHITRNKKKMENIIKKSDCKLIYEQLACETHKTANIDKYIRYVRIIFKNWKEIWSFNSELKLASIKYDTKINKEKASSELRSANKFAINLFIIIEYFIIYSKIYILLDFFLFSETHNGCKFKYPKDSLIF